MLIGLRVWCVLLAATDAAFRCNERWIGGISGAMHEGGLQQ